MFEMAKKIINLWEKMYNGKYFTVIKHPLIGKVKMRFNAIQGCTTHCLVKERQQKVGPYRFEGFLEKAFQK